MTAVSFAAHVEEFALRLREAGITRDRTGALRPRLERYNAYSVPRRARGFLAIYCHYSGRPDLSAARVLDVGCGYGGISCFLAADGAAREVVAMDRNRGALRFLAATVREWGLTHVLPVEADLRSLPFGQGAFDLILVSDLFYFRWIDVGNTLDELFTMLAPRGVLMLKVPNRLFPLDGVTLLPLVQFLPRRMADWAVRTSRRRSTYQDIWLPSSFGLARTVSRAGFQRVKVYEPYRHGDRCQLRFFLPSFVLAGSRPD